MEDSLDLHKTIINSLHGLPDSSLREIAEYIFFIRQKALSPIQFQQQFEEMLLVEEMESLEVNEISHLEEEFKDYKNLYPKD